MASAIPILHMAHNGDITLTPFGALVVILVLLSVVVTIIGWRS